MFQKTGIAISILGVMAAESPCLLVPIVLIGIGVVLYMIGTKRGEQL